jgi:hypothetical protein
MIDQFSLFCDQVNIPFWKIAMQAKTLIIVLQTKTQTYVDTDTSFSTALFVLDE